uniref:MFS transporter n=1 Tax=Trichogramma kaykai TaxID=54128 RepID=A0ABD2X4C5_9HYME
MTSNSLIYKLADVKSRVAPQIFLIFLAVLIFYQSYYMHTGFLTVAHMRFFDEALTFFVSTLSYVLMIVPAGILATNWNATKLLCLSIAGIGL